MARRSAATDAASHADASEVAVDPLDSGLADGGASDEEPSVIETYDAQSARCQINGVANDFVDKVKATWRGDGDRYHRLMGYTHYLRNTAMFVLLGFFVYGFTCGLAASIIPRGGQIGEPVGWFAHILVVATAAAVVWVRNMQLDADLSTLDDTLFRLTDACVEKDLKKRLDNQLALLPTSGSTERDAEDGARRVVEIMRLWRTLERIPHYIIREWQLYRLSIRDPRQSKLIVGFLLLVALATLSFVPALVFNNAIAGFSDNTALKGLEAAGGFKTWPFNDATVGAMRSYLIASALASVAAGAAYQLVKNHWKTKTLVYVNNGLRVGTKILGAPVVEDSVAQSQQVLGTRIDWRLEIASMDPTAVLAKNYRSVLAGFIRASAK
ncbi:MAG: hypothetical protein ACFB00_12365 [Parvularculaceae bacterium]